MKIQFQPDTVDGRESVMDTTSLNVNEIRFDIATREIFLVCEDKEDFGSMSWQKLKARVLAKGGKWTNKADAIAFLEG